MSLLMLLWISLLVSLSLLISLLSLPLLPLLLPLHYRPQRDTQFIHQTISSRPSSRTWPRIVGSDRRELGADA